MGFGKFIVSLMLVEPRILSILRFSGSPVSRLLIFPRFRVVKTVTFKKQKKCCRSIKPFCYSMEDQLYNYDNIEILSAIISSSDDAIISKTLAGVITSWNPAAEKMFGFTEKEAIGNNITMVIPTELLSEEADIIFRIKKGEKIDHFETMRQRKDGKYFPVAVTISPIKNSDGIVVGASKIVRDVSDYKNFEEKQALLVSIIASSDDAIVSKTLDGIITSWNHGAEHIFGFTAMEAIGSHISIIIPPEKMDEEAMIIEKIRNGERINHIETIRRKKDGTSIELSITISPIKTTSGKIIGASKIARDISEKAEIEREKKLLTERLQRINDYKDEFMAMASHELKTPLTVAKANLDVLGIMLDGLQENSFLVKASEQIDKLANLISHLLDASKMQSGMLDLQPVRFDLIELYKDVIKNIVFTNLGYDVVLLSHHVQIFMIADRERLEQVIINLLANAVKYSPENKTIEVAVTIENGEVVSRISDRGIGISAEDKEKIFNRFFRAGGIAATYAGSGIGLYISDQIIKRHGGKIWVESEINNGSSFYFSMPVVSE